MSAQRLAIRIFIGVVVIALLVGGTIWVSLDRSDKAGTTARQVTTTAEENARTNRRQRQRIDANTIKINRTLRCLSTAKRPQNCIARVAGSGSKGPAARMGQRGERGLSVVGKRGSRGAQGPQGPPGRDAPPITPERLQEQLRALCGGSCNGERGTPGVDGVGTDGAPGKDAPPPTDEQVLAAVATYCAAHNNCQPASQPGPPGPQGPPGMDGQPAPPTPLVPCSMQPVELGYQCAPPLDAPP